MYAHPLRTAPRQKILVPTDGSATEDAALRHVIDASRTSPLVVHLLNVQPPVMAGDVTLFTTAAMAAQQRRRAGDRALKRASAALTAARVAHTTEVALGSTASEIVRAAAAQACSKIVMATRSTGFLNLLLRRSVAQRVVALAPVPVTLVRPGSVRVSAPGGRAENRLQTTRLCA